MCGKTDADALVAAASEKPETSVLPALRVRDASSGSDRRRARAPARSGIPPRRPSTLSGRFCILGVLIALLVLTGEHLAPGRDGGHVEFISISISKTSGLGFSIQVIAGMYFDRRAFLVAEHGRHGSRSAAVDAESVHYPRVAVRPSATTRRHAREAATSPTANTVLMRMIWAAKPFPIEAHTPPPAMVPMAVTITNRMKTTGR